jgi:hypothetical protein
VVSPVLKVVSATGPVPGALLSGSVLLAYEKHSLAILRYSFATSDKSSRVPTLAEHTPVVLTYGRGVQGTEKFYGYVNHHEVLPTDALRTYIVEYTLIGSSLPMNRQETRSWSEVSASYVARDIAARHGFRTFLHRHERVREYVVQDGGSDMAMLGRLAQETGYRFWCHNGTLWFVNPRILVSGPKTDDIPSYRMDRSPGLVDTMDQFHLISGSTVEEGGVLADRRVYGYDPRSKEFIEATDTSPSNLLSLVDKTPVSSLSEATAVLEAQSTKNRNWLVAKARVDGTAMLRPGALIYLIGSAMPAASRGYWLVTGAEHEVEIGIPGQPATQRFSTNVELVRDADTTVTFTDTQTLSPARERATARLNSKMLWESDLIEDHYLG